VTGHGAHSVGEIAPRVPLQGAKTCFVTPPYCSMEGYLVYCVYFLFVIFWPDCTPEGQLFSAVCLSVCLCVCLWPALLPSTLTDFDETWVTRTLLWSSLAATIMVQIGRRGTPCDAFLKFSKNSLKSQFEFQNSDPSFFASVFPVYCNCGRWESFRGLVDIPRMCLLCVNFDGGRTVWAL